MSRLIPQTLDRWPKHGVWGPVVLLLGYTFALAFLSVADFPASMDERARMPFLSVRPVGDDGFYYLSIAWNMAAGRGLTVDHMTPTTGIQPLVPILWALPARCIQWLGGTRWDLVRFVIAFGGINLVCFALVAARCAETLCTFVGSRESYLVFLLTLGNYPLFRLFTYGLETGAYLTLIAVCIILSSEFEDGGVGGALGMGAVFGMTGLVRLDFGVALACFYTASLVSGRLSLRYVLASGATALAIVSPWLAWTYHHLGTIVPSSGIAEGGFILYHDHALYRVYTGMEAVLEHVIPFVHVQSSSIWVYVSLLAAGVMAYGTQRRWSSDDVSTLLDGHARYWYLAFGVFPLVYVMNLRSLWFYHRYLAPLFVLFVPFVAAALLALSDEIRERYHRVEKYVTYAGMGLLGLQCAGWTAHGLHLGDYAPADKAVAAGEIRDRFEAEEVTIGAFQTGVISYFNDSVVNLDGKVNNEVLPYLRDDRICEYMRRIDLDILVGAPSLLRHRVPEACLKAMWRPCRRAFRGPFLCLSAASGSR